MNADNATYNPTPKVAICEGDSRDMDAIEDGQADLVVTSPPYNLDVDYDDHDDDMHETDYRALLHDAFAECKRVLASDGRLAVNVGYGVARPMGDIPRWVADIAEEVGFNLRDRYVWDKGPVDGSSAFGSWRSASNPRQSIQHEAILVFYADEPGREDYVRESMSKREFMEYRQSVWRVDPVKATEWDYDHPAPFPPEIPERLITMYSYPGDLVVDPFAGSGTTLLVADRLDRQAVGFEKSRDYARLAAQRCASPQSNLDDFATGDD